MLSVCYRRSDAVGRGRAAGQQPHARVRLHCSGTGAPHTGQADRPSVGSVAPQLAQRGRFARRMPPRRCPSLQMNGADNSGLATAPSFQSNAIQEATTTIRTLNSRICPGCQRPAHVHSGQFVAGHDRLVTARPWQLPPLLARYAKPRLATQAARGVGLCKPAPLYRTTDQVVWRHTWHTASNSQEARRRRRHRHLRAADASAGKSPHSHRTSLTKERRTRRQRGRTA